MVKFNLFLIEDFFVENAPVFDVFRQEPPSNLIYPEYTPSDSTQPYLTLIQQRISDVISSYYFCSGVLEISSEMKGVGFFYSQIGLNIPPTGSSSLSFPCWTNLDRAKM